MQIQKYDGELCIISYKGRSYQGEILQALNEALQRVFFGEMVASPIGNYPPGYDNEGMFIGKDW